MAVGEPDPRPPDGGGGLGERKSGQRMEQSGRERRETVRASSRDSERAGKGGPKTERDPEEEKTEQENTDDKREAEREKAKRTEREREEGNQIRAEVLGGGRGRRKRMRERKQKNRKKRREQVLCC